VRVTTAFNRLLRLPGAAVTDVSFGSEGVIVTVRLRRRRRVCSRCGQLGGAIHDRRIKRWRHLDLGSEPVRDRVRAAAAVVPGLRRPTGGGPVGQGRLSIHP